MVLFFVDLQVDADRDEHEVFYDVANLFDKTFFLPRTPASKYTPNKVWYFAWKMITSEIKISNFKPGFLGRTVLVHWMDPQVKDKWNR